MSPWITVAKWILLLSWIASGGLLAWNHLRVRKERKRQSIPEEKPSIRDPKSMQGLAIEGLSFLLAAIFTSFADTPADWQCILSTVFSLLAVALFAVAIHHLGLEWRIKAVVTDDHRLVTTGPYSIVRHPIFAALISLLLATSLLANPPWATPLCLAVCLYGTEIRVKAEDGLLLRKFGPEFASYRARVPAYLPFFH
ncbi:MAG: isoprenylcysteine carboxylmethyltransferase family protein [Bryobacterales bacterium]|nr:isoprenylcysteine carboxylmethyltransferase family protein [Bryobacterales bacterium]